LLKLGVKIEMTQLINSNINIVCVLKTGGSLGYDNEWVKKLHRALLRNLTIPFTFYCLSDVELEGINIIPLEIYKDVPPKLFWYKMQLFKNREFVNSPTLYLDLDLIICQNIDTELGILINQKEFVMLWENNSHRENVPSTSNSSVMYWNGDYRFLWEKFISNPPYYYEVHSVKDTFGDQGFIKDNVKHIHIQNLLGEEKFSWANRKGGEPATTKFLIFTKPSKKPNKFRKHKLINTHWI